MNSNYSHHSEGTLGFLNKTIKEDSESEVTFSDCVHLVGLDRYVCLLESVDAKWRYSAITMVFLLVCIAAFVFLFACESVVEESC